MTIAAFYDQLCSFYHVIYPDWEASIAKQAEDLDSVIRQVWGQQVSTVLDVACGIGTQAIGLAACGYQVTASDLSPKSIARARREAEQRQVHIDFSVADMRQAQTTTSMTSLPPCVLSASPFPGSFSMDVPVATGYDPLLDNELQLARTMAASVRQCIAFGERAGQKVRRIASGFGYVGERPELKGARCASVNGFSLHANTQVPAHRRDQLERLIRYTARGAVSLDLYRPHTSLPRLAVSRCGGLPPGAGGAAGTASEQRLPAKGARMPQGCFQGCAPQRQALKCRLFFLFAIHLMLMGGQNVRNPP